MNKVLLLCSHPDLPASHANKALLDSVKDLAGVTTIHLDTTPFDVEQYRSAFQEAHVLIFQFPLYWGSAPALLKKWSDEIFVQLIDKGAAKGKHLMVATTCGAPIESFGPEGSNLFPIETLMTPYHLQANYSGMGWLPPFAVYDTENEKEQVNAFSKAKAKYKTILENIVNGK